MAKLTTTTYDQVNAEDVKLPVIVLEIEGLPYTFSSARVFTRIRYDDPGVNYDGTDPVTNEVFVYDGLRAVSTNQNKSYIDRATSMATISQKLEQWDGRASVETLSINLVDVNGLITQLCTPGVVLDDILNKKVKVYFGYQNISFPQDYVVIFKGYINQYQLLQGSVKFTFTDPSSRRKQEVFSSAKTTLTGNITNTSTTIPVVSNTLFYKTILNAKGVNDTTVTIGMVIGSEIITYTNSGINVNGIQIDSVTRGAFGTVAASHSSGDTVEMFIQFDDNPINIALKTMLSGWNGPCFTNVALRGIVNTDGNPSVPDSITFGPTTDLIRDYGLAIGDFITLSGSPNSPNNATFTIASFLNDNRTCTVIETGILIQENPTPVTVAAFRSQFDTYPVDAGLMISTDDVDTQRHVDLRNTFITFNFVMNIKGAENSGKDWIETHLMKAMGGYSLTQGSRISMGLTHPPLSTDLTKIIDHTNTINAKEINVTRGLTTRFYYNEILFNYAFDPIAGDFAQSLAVEDAGAQARTHQVSTLQIDVRGLPAGSTSETILKQRAQRLLLRYRYAAETVQLKTKFSTGHTIDAGDIVVLTDLITNGVQTPLIKISNTENGTRGVYDRVMEVQERTIMLSDGNTKLTLLSNNGFSLTDRYAVISPSSLVDTGIDASTFTIKESFGGRFPGQEYRKWNQYEGYRIKIHDATFTNVGSSTFTLDLSNPFKFHLATPLAFTPGTDYIVEFDDYDETSSVSQKLIKSQFTFIDRTGDIASGTSSTVFTLQTGQGSNYIPSNICYVMAPDGSRKSQDVKILSVVGDIITVGQISPSTPSNLGFTPQAGDFLKLGGFKDAGQSYRYT